MLVDTTGMNRLHAKEIGRVLFREHGPVMKGARGDALTDGKSKEVSRVSHMTDAALSTLAHTRCSTPALILHQSDERCYDLQVPPVAESCRMRPARQSVDSSGTAGCDCPCQREGPMHILLSVVQRDTSCKRNHVDHHR